MEIQNISVTHVVAIPANSFSKNIELILIKHFSESAYEGHTFNICNS